MYQRISFFAGAAATLAFFLSCGNGPDPVHAQLTEPVQLEEPVTVEGTVGVTGAVTVSGAVEVTNPVAAYVPAREDPALAVRHVAAVDGTTEVDDSAEPGGFFISDAFVFRNVEAGVSGFLYLSAPGQGCDTSITGRQALRDTDSQYVSITGANIYVPVGSRVCFQGPGFAQINPPSVTVIGYRPRVSGN